MERSRTNFRLISTQNIEEYDAILYTYEHLITKTPVYDLVLDEPNNTFGIAFGTPSYSETGVAHILEHSVLNGSRGYPVKESFGELVKKSLATFLNAMTYYDKTLYPLSSLILQDFYNAMGVYLDAVFFPLLSHKTFGQEGHHLEYDAATDSLSYKGVVFNEMKGAFGNADRWLEMNITQTVLPNTIYSQESGGDPRVIPTLTYEDFKAFHAKYYHPSNAQVIFVGDNEDVRKFEILDTYLSQFTNQDIPFLQSNSPLREDQKSLLHSPLTKTELWSSPRQATLPTPSDTYTVTSTTLIDNHTNIHEKLMHEFISRLLFDGSHTPIYSMLIDSQLGTEVYSGDPDPVFQTLFTFGLKGISQDNLTKAQELITNALAKSLERINAELIMATLNKMEFDLRSMSLGMVGYPKSIGLVDRILQLSLYGGDVHDSLRFNDFIRDMRHDDDIVATVKWWIESHLVTNPHTAIITHEPRPDMLSSRDEEERAELDALRKSLTYDQIESIIQFQEELETWQKTDDTQEIKDTIPSLNPEDINPLADIDHHNLDDNIIITTLETHGITYAQIACDLSQIDYELIPYLPILQQCLGEVNTHRSYQEIQLDLSMYTGGFGSYNIISKSEQDDDVYYTVWTIKHLDRYNDQSLALLEEILMDTKFDDSTRVLKIIKEYVSALESSLLSSGHSTVLKNTSKFMSPQARVRSLASSFESYEFWKSIRDTWETSQADVMSKLTLLYTQLKTKLVGGITASPETIGHPVTTLRAMIHRIQLASAGSTSKQWNIELNPQNWLQKWDSQVSYHSIVIPMKLESSDAATANIVSQYISRNYYWAAIRVNGGAYGAGAMINVREGYFGSYSYRDPNRASTFKVFRETPKHLKNLRLTEKELWVTKLGVFADLDDHLEIEDKALQSVSRHLLGSTYEIRQSKRDNIFGATLEDIHSLAEKFDSEHAVEGSFGQDIESI